MDKKNLDYDVCLEDAIAFHGDLCGGVITGTRIALIGLKAIDILDPKGKDRKNIIVFAETDRCVTDAILAVTGCHPGKRTMKILDYGKMAATFVNLKTGKAVRVSSKNRDGDSVITRDDIERNPRTDTHITSSDEELFNVQEVFVNISPEDLPGKPLRIVTCSSCGERIMDMKEVYRDGKTLCRPCAHNSDYYEAMGTGLSNWPS